jgi:hypothetical protein
MASKRYRGKDCAYCGKRLASTEGDHVIAREFFFEQDRANLPQVPACKACNNQKSALEHYVSAALMAGSNHPHGDRYRREKVSPRLARNRKLQADIGMHNPPVWMNVRGIVQPMHVLKLDAEKINALMSLIVRGLYFFHYGRPLDKTFCADVSMFAPDHEPALWASVVDYFPSGSVTANADLGHGSFIYEGARSPAHPDLTVWRMTWHGGVRLHGANSPPQGISIFWGFTRPTPEAVAAAQSTPRAEPPVGQGASAT